jgi:2-methylisocitrate lyase-like PEP mutase family enzyme
MATSNERAQRFRDLHHGENLLLLPNPWDAGSARVLAALGYDALATTSAGFAGTLGRRDGNVTRDEALEHAAVIVNATDLPVSADLENGYADAPSGVADTITRARATGLAGCSVEDYDGERLYEVKHSAERVLAAAEAAHQDGSPFVLTARAENHIRGNPDLADTIARLQAFQEAGADVLYAPGVSTLDDITTLVKSVDLPVNVLALPGAPTIAELSAAGVARVSVGGAFAHVALGALATAARELKEQGTYEFWQTAGAGMQIASKAFSAASPRTPE